jgi:hypothetical protein
VVENDVLYINKVLSQECYVQEPSSLIILVGGYGVFINDG